MAYAFETKVGEGRLLVTSLRFRDHFDEAYPEALDLFDRFLLLTACIVRTDGGGGRRAVAAAGVALDHWRSSPHRRV